MFLKCGYNQSLSSIDIKLSVKEVRVAAGGVPNQIVYEDPVTQDACKLQVW